MGIFLKLESLSLILESSTISNMAGECSRFVLLRRYLRLSEEFVLCSS